MIINEEIKDSRDTIFQESFKVSYARSAKKNNRTKLLVNKKNFQILFYEIENNDYFKGNLQDYSKAIYPYMERQ